VRALSAIRSYDSGIPAFLHNRPPKFIEHCLPRLPPAVNIPPDHVIEVAHGLFTVHSESVADMQYRVHLKSTEAITAPACECTDWCRRHLPCKHMLAVMTLHPHWTWDNLPHHYTSLAQFQLDPDLMEAVQQTVSVSDVIAEEVHGQPDDTEQQQQQDVQSGNEPRSTTAPEVPVPPATGIQKKVRLHLSQLASLSYKVSDIDCLKRVVDALTVLQQDMRTNAASDRAFLILRQSVEDTVSYLPTVRCTAD